MKSAPTVKLISQISKTKKRETKLCRTRRYYFGTDFKLIIFVQNLLFFCIFKVSQVIWIYLNITILLFPIYIDIKYYTNKNILLFIFYNFSLLFVINAYAKASSHQEREE